MDQKKSASKTGSLHGGDIYRNKVDLDFSVSLNPCEVPASFYDAVRGSLSRIDQYPDPSYERLRKSIALMDGADPEDIVCGNGASELIMALVHTFMPEKALIAAPCYAGYRVALEAVYCEITEYHLDEASEFELKHDFVDCLTDDLDMVFVTNPNNPNGRLIDEDIIKEMINVCGWNGIIPVIDECFLPLTGRGTGFPDADGNCIRLRAFTKTFAMPGLRLGYTLCKDHGFNSAIRKHLPEWNISVAAEEAGIAAAKIAAGTDYIRRSAEMTETQRGLLKEALENLGIRVFASDANYLLLKTGPGVHEKLLERGILVRDCSNFSGLDGSFIRVAVRSSEDNERLIHELEEIMRQRT